MAISFLRPYSELETWRTFMHENPWHFNQLTGHMVPLNKGCSVYIQSERERITDGLAIAYTNLRYALSYDLRPRWHSDSLPLPFGLSHIYSTQWGYVQEFGQRKLELIEADASVVYSDVSGDGLDDTATVSVTSADAQSEEVLLFFRVTDGALAAGDDRFIIEPVRATKSGSTITITGGRYLFVKPSLWQQEYTTPDYLNRNSGDPNLTAPFVVAVDVYREYVDPDLPSVIFHTDPETHATPEIVDARLGLFTLAPCTCANCPRLRSRPERMTVHYRGGYPLLNGLMDPALGMALTRLSNLYIQPAPQATCGPVQAAYADDLMEYQNDSRTGPWGSQRAALTAWALVRDIAIGQGGRA